MDLNVLVIHSDVLCACAHEEGENTGNYNLHF